MLYAIIVLLIIANIIKIGADVGAMAAALKLLLGGPAQCICKMVNRGVSSTPRIVKLPSLSDDCEP